MMYAKQHKLKKDYPKFVIYIAVPFMTFSDYLEGMYEADAKIERESVTIDARFR